MGQRRFGLAHDQGLMNGPHEGPQQPARFLHRSAAEIKGDTHY